MFFRVVKVLVIGGFILGVAIGARAIAHVKRRA